MSVTDPNIVRPAPSVDSLPVIATTFAAVVLGWFPAVFLGDAVADAAGAGSELALFVTLLAYVLMVAAPRLLRRVL